MGLCCRGSALTISCVQVDMQGCKGAITTFIVEPFVPHDDEYYLSIVSDRLGTNVSFSECGGIEIEENWDKVSLRVFLDIQPMSRKTIGAFIEISTF